MKFKSLTSVLLLSLAASAVAQVANPGFEDPVTSDGPPFVGFWEAFNGGAGTSSANSGLYFHSGAQSLGLSINNTLNTFAGAFQDIPGVTPGTAVAFGGWHLFPSAPPVPPNVVVEVRIEWRNSVSNTEVSRTPNSNPVPSTAWTPFSLNAIVPAGADTARIVYAIQSFFPGGGAGNNAVYVDDITFVVPEPGTMMLLGLGGVALVAIRRQRA